MAPSIVIVPGLWLGPRPYELLVEEINKAKPSITDFVYAPLKSTGHASPGNPTMMDDAMGVREVVKPIVESGKRVVIISHSSSACISAMSTEGLEVGEVLAAPSGGGVERFIFITGGILPIGAPHPELSPVDIKNSEMYCHDAENALFHDVNTEVTQKYSAFIKCQPATDWSVACPYTGWEKVASTYILCENDRQLSPKVKEMCAQIAKSEVIKIPTGHLPMLAKPQLLAEKVVACMKLNDHLVIERHSNVLKWE